MLQGGTSEYLSRGWRHFPGFERQWAVLPGVPEPWGTTLHVGRGKEFPFQADMEKRPSLPGRGRLHPDPGGLITPSTGLGGVGA
jgi:hypothetical protein